MDECSEPASEEAGEVGRAGMGGVVRRREGPGWTSRTGGGGGWVVGEVRGRIVTADWAEAPVMVNPDVPGRMTIGEAEVPCCRFEDDNVTTVGELAVEG